MPEAVIRKAMEVIPGVDFYQAYGQTEASPIAALTRPDDPKVLEGFYRKVRPGGWWGPIARAAPEACSSEGITISSA